MIRATIYGEDDGSDGAAVRTEPTCYGWLPGYVRVPDSGELLCRACALRDVDSYVDMIGTKPQGTDRPFGPPG